ncbi:MAG: hypothetical protein KAT18_02485 [Candidatus Latescibacteria bacterium]|nr:hypothetical protein [Candidatus Latescibacterota bacterium]
MLSVPLRNYGDVSRASKRAAGKARGGGIAVSIATTSNTAGRNASAIEYQRNYGAVH